MSLLNSTDPYSIEELLDRDPLEITQEEVDANTDLMIAGFKTERDIWITEKAKAKLTGTKVSGNTVKKKQKAAVLEQIKKSSVKLDLSKMMKP